MSSQLSSRIRTRLVSHLSLIYLLLFIVILFPTRHLRAFKASLGDGSSETFLVTAPVGTNPYPFENVVRVNGASGVYLGGGWVLTAEHVGYASEVVVGGVTYAASDAGMRLDVLNDDGADADLILFRLDYSSPDDANLALNLAGADEGDSVFMAGFGGAASRTWATNVVEHIPNDTPGVDYSNVAVGSVDSYTISLYTAFNLDVVNDGQGVPGDSGGGVFVQNGGGWDLGGITFAINTSGDPDLTYFADLDPYEQTLTRFMFDNGNAPSLIPEPETVFLLAAAACLLGTSRRRAGARR